MQDVASLREVKSQPKPLEDSFEVHCELRSSRVPLSHLFCCNKDTVRMLLIDGMAGVVDVG